MSDEISMERITLSHCACNRHLELGRGLQQYLFRYLFNPGSATDRQLWRETRWQGDLIHAIDFLQATIALNAPSQQNLRTLSIAVATCLQGPIASRAPRPPCPERSSTVAITGLQVLTA